MKIVLVIQNKTAQKIPSKKKIEGWILETLKTKNIEADVEIGLNLVPKEEIKRLNKKFRQIDKVTDVLSFPIMDKAPRKNKFEST